MFRPSKKFARLAAFAIVPVALVVSGIAVSTASYSAFSATTSNEGSNWSMGSVALSNDTAKGALFSAANLKPGTTGTNCIAVTSTGTLPSAVKLYASNTRQNGDLASYVSLQVRQGAGGGYGSCQGFRPAAEQSVAYSGSLGSFAQSNTSYASGVGTWQTEGGAAETQVFEITYTVAPDAPASVMGATASLGFTWEAQNL